MDVHKYREWPIVLGEFNGMEKATLINCRSGSGRMGAGGSVRIIRAKFLLEGVHLSAHKELEFTKLVTFSPALHDWIRENDWIEGKGSQYTIPDHKEVVRIQLPDFELIINKGHSIRHGVELHAQNVCSVQFLSKQPIHLNEILEALHHFRKFVLFITNADPEFDQYFLNIGDTQYELKMSAYPLEDKKFSMPLEIEYRDVKDDLPVILENWFTEQELNPVIDLVLEKLFNPGLSIPAFFLNVCIASELFHRRFKAGLIDKITLLNRLRHFKPIIAHIIGNSFPFDCEEFMRRVKETRNEMAHEGTWKKHFSVVELLLASKVLEYTLRIEILKLFKVDVQKGHDPLLDQARNNIERLAYLNDYNQHAPAKQ